MSMLRYLVTGANGLLGLPAASARRLLLRWSAIRPQGERTFAILQKEGLRGLWSRHSSHHRPARRAISEYAIRAKIGRLFDRPTQAVGLSALSPHYGQYGINFRR